MYMKLTASHRFVGLGTLASWIALAAVAPLLGQHHAPSAEHSTTAEASTASPHGAMEGQPPQAILNFPPQQSMVEVPFRLYLNKIIVPVTLNGAGPFDFVLDTGASSALLHARHHPDDLKLDIIGQATVQGAGGGDGMNIDLAGNVTFGLGDVELRQGILAVAPGDSDMARHMGSNWQGVFGSQVFNNLVVEIDWIHEVLRLYPPDGYSAHADDTALPLDLSQGHAFIDASLDVDGTSERPIRLVLDTGAYHAVALSGTPTPPAYLENVLLGRGLNGKIHGGVGRVAQLRLGNYAFDGVVASFPQADLAPIITGGSDGNLGSEILRRFTVTFDYARQRMLLRPNATFAAPFTFSTSGLRVRTSVSGDGTLEIDDIYAGSPAAEATIATSDRLLSINGQPVSGMASEDVLALLEGAPGTTLALGLRRQGKDRQVSIQLRELLPQRPSTP